MVDQNTLERLLSNTGDMCLKRRAKLLIKELNPRITDKILDIGCGDGYYLFLLSNLGNFDLVGIDRDRKALFAARNQVNNKKIKLIQGDILKLPFQKETFNKIILSEVLEHLEDDGKALREIARVIKKKGILVITVPHWNFPFFWDPVNYLLQRLLKTHINKGFWSGVWSNHLRLYRVNELKKILKDAGFKIEKVECLTHYGLPFNHYLTNIGFRLRTSNKLSKELRSSMSKFNPNAKKSWFNYILDSINWLDKRNDRKFSERTSSVGIFLKASKI